MLKILIFALHYIIWSACVLYAVIYASKYNKAINNSVLILFLVGFVNVIIFFYLLILRYNLLHILYKIVFLIHMVALVIIVIIRASYLLIIENDAIVFKQMNETKNLSVSFSEVPDLYYYPSSTMMFQAFYCTLQCLIAIFYFQLVEEKTIEHILEDLIIFFARFLRNEVIFFCN